MSQYCLSWDNHSTNVLLNLTKFYECQQLLDITLSCENQKIGVHKCILMAGSLYFKEHLQKYSDTRIIALKTIEYKTLKLLIEFMYRGEVYVNEKDLNSVLVAAKFFKIHGLNGIKLDDITNSDSESYHIEDPEFIKLTKESGTSTTEVQETLEDLSKESNIPVDLSVEHEVVINPVNDTVPIEPEAHVESIDNEKKVHAEAPQENSEPIITEIPSVNDTVPDENCSVTDTVIEEAPYEVFGTEEYIEEHLDSLDENDYTDNEDPLSQDVSYSTHKDGSEVNKKEVLQMLQEAGIPTDVPIFCEDGDGKYVELTQDIVEEIASGGQVIYQVVDEDGNAGDLLLGTAVRKSRASSRQDCNTSDRIPADDLDTNIPCPASPHHVADSVIHESEIEHNPHVHHADVESENVEIENKGKTSARAPRDRKMNSRYFNSNITSPFLELRQKRGHKRKRSISENDIKIEKDVDIKKEIVCEQVSEFCDIEQKIAELHADNGDVDDRLDEHTTVVLETVNGYQKSDDGNILKVLSGVGNGDAQTASQKRPLHHPNKSKVPTEVQIVNSPRRKTSSDNSDTSSQSTSKEIPYALGLLPLQKALKKIQNMPDYTPRKTRSNIQNVCSSKVEIKSSNDTTNGFGDKEIKNGAFSTKKIESDKYDVLRKKRKGI